MNEKEIQRQKRNKRLLLCAILLFFVIVAAAVAYSFFGPEKEVSVYKETQVMRGDLTVGITEDGDVEVGTIDQRFELDISEYTSSNNNGRGGGPFGGLMMGGGGSGSGRELEVEEVYACVGQQIRIGDPLFKLTEESVDKIREKLAADEKEAKLTLDKLLTEQKKTSETAKQEYDRNQVYGNAASLEYEEALHDLLKEAEDAQEAYEDALEDLADLQDDYNETAEDYEQAKHYLKETEAAVSEEKDAYWYLQNEESREQAYKIKEEEKDKLEDLEDKIFDKNMEILMLKTQWDEAVIAYQKGEAEAKSAYDLRILKQKKAGEIYGLATDRMDYEARTAREDYEDAEEKLENFDAYIVDGVVSAAYNGVITAVSLEQGSKVKKDTSVITINHFDDITIKVDVDDDDMDQVHVGDPVNLYFSAFPDGNFSGKVSDIGDASIDSNSNVSYEVTISVSGDTEGLYSGMTGKVTFVTDERKETIYVSNRALTTDADGNVYAQRYDENGDVVRVFVETGFTDGKNTEIRSGLSEGDMVLIESKVKG